MTRKINILNLIASEMAKINGEFDKRPGSNKSPYLFKSKVAQVFPRFKFIQELNDFPVICFIAGTETRTHIGGGIKYGSLDLVIRGYIKSENVIDAEDDLLEDMEYIIDTLSHTSDACAQEIEEARVINVGSDEGLVEPYGVCELQCEIVYQLDSTL